jgi:hypothetical protein
MPKKKKKGNDQNRHAGQQGKTKERSKQCNGSMNVIVFT